MSTLESRHLFDLKLQLGAINTIGQTPVGNRVIGNLAGGAFEGERLRGRVLPSGGDWGLFMPDGTLSVDGRMCLETEEGALVYAIYTGRWRIHPDMLVKLADPVTAKSVQADDYYLRINFLFETTMEQYHWLNQIIAVGVGQKTERGIDYVVHQVL